MLDPQTQPVPIQLLLEGRTFGPEDDQAASEGARPSRELQEQKQAELLSWRLRGRSAPGDRPGTGAHYGSEIDDGAKVREVAPARCCPDMKFRVQVLFGGLRGGVPNPQGPQQWKGAMSVHPGLRSRSGAQVAAAALPV